ncbi:hypothetical protein BJY52DRAFT_1420157 [Lactarius psammicola]|nr:hypothetical protein BJY52DRAFT_1420157 [Lactarius psammicola]
MSNTASYKFCGVPVHEWDTHGKTLHGMKEMPPYSAVASSERRSMEEGRSAWMGVVGPLEAGWVRLRREETVEKGCLMSGPAQWRGIGYEVKDDVMAIPNRKRYYAGTRKVGRPHLFVTMGFEKGKKMGESTIPMRVGQKAGQSGIVKADHRIPLLECVFDLFQLQPPRSNDHRQGTSHVVLPRTGDASVEGVLTVIQTEHATTTAVSLVVDGVLYGSPEGHTCYVRDRPRQDLHGCGSILILTPVLERGGAMNDSKCYISPTT